jgi:hypothetical protein
LLIGRLVESVEDLYYNRETNLERIFLDSLCEERRLWAEDEFVHVELAFIALDDEVRELARLKGTK